MEQVLRTQVRELVLEPHKKVAERMVVEPHKSLVGVLHSLKIIRHYLNPDQEVEQSRMVLVALPVTAPTRMRQPPTENIFSFNTFPR